MTQRNKNISYIIPMKYPTINYKCQFLIMKIILSTPQHCISRLRNTTNVQWWWNGNPLELAKCSCHCTHSSIACHIVACHLVLWSSCWLIFYSSIASLVIICWYFVLSVFCWIHYLPLTNQSHYLWRSQFLKQRTPPLFLLPYMKPRF